MQIRPAIGFYWRQYAQIEKTFGGAKGNIQIVIDVAEAAVPLLKKYRPSWNENGLLDDALKTLKEVLAPETPFVPPDRSDNTA